MSTSPRAQGATEPKGRGAARIINASVPVMSQSKISSRSLRSMLSYSPLRVS